MIFLSRCFDTIYSLCRPRFDFHLSEFNFEFYFSDSFLAGGGGGGGVLLSSSKEAK